HQPRRHALSHAAGPHRHGAPPAGGSGPVIPAGPSGAPMKIAILSRNTRLYSTQRLVEAARARGHSVRVLDPLRCYMRIGVDGIEMHYKGRELADYDAVLPRIGASVSRYGTAVLRQDRKSTRLNSSHVT